MLQILFWLKIFDVLGSWFFITIPLLVMIALVLILVGIGIVLMVAAKLYILLIPTIWVFLTLSSLIPVCIFLPAFEKDESFRYVILVSFTIFVLLGFLGIIGRLYS